MHSNMTIEIDIQEESEKAENMMDQFGEIIKKHQEAPLNEALFNSVAYKIEKKQKYFDKHNFPPILCVITVWGVALVEKEQRKVMLAQKVIMSPHYDVSNSESLGTHSS